MEEKWIEKAVEYKHDKHNCAQAVAHAIADMKGIDAKEFLKIASGFGSGIGTMENTCGALVGAVMMKGIETSGVDTKSKTSKMSDAFKKSCGSLFCKDLKGVETGKVLCSCDDCVRNAMRSFDIS